jgi:twitching motility protein PilI
MTQPTLSSNTDSPNGPDAGARHTRLREFQTQLVARVHAAAAGTASQSSQLGVLIGQTRWLLDLREAGEIVSVGSITRVPLTQDWYVGLTNIRGNLVSVVDLARFSGMALTPVDKESRIIAFAPALAFNGGLLVSRLLGLRNVDEMEMQSSIEDATWVKQRYVDRDSHIWNELNLSLLVQDQQFLHVGL